MQFEQFVFDCPDISIYHPSSPGRISMMRMVVNRYYHSPISKAADDEEGLTLVFAHCLGSHKEIWEPIISSLFDLARDSQRRVVIREAYAFDRENHGDSAILNKDILDEMTKREDYPNGFDGAISMASFFQTRLQNRKNMIAIGHSGGAGSLMLSSRNYALSSLPFSAIILIEPVFMTSSVFASNISKMVSAFLKRMQITRAKKDTWNTKREAFLWLQGKMPWNGWDERMLKLYVEHGLSNLPDGRVTLKCPKAQEALSFPDAESQIAAMTELQRIGGIVPMHIIWGSRAEFVDQNLRTRIQETGACASISLVDGADHLAVQEKPDEVTKIIWDILCNERREPSSAFAAKL